MASGVSVPAGSPTTRPVPRGRLRADRSIGDYIGWDPIPGKKRPGVVSRARAFQVLQYLCADDVMDNALAWPGRREISERTGLHQRRVQEALYGLEQLGAIRKLGIRERASLYELKKVVSDIAAPAKGARRKASAVDVDEAQPGAGYVPGARGRTAKREARLDEAKSELDPRVTEFVAELERILPNKEETIRGNGKLFAAFRLIIDRGGTPAGLVEYLGKKHDLPWVRPGAWIPDVIRYADTLRPTSTPPKFDPSAPVVTCDHDAELGKCALCRRAAGGGERASPY
jgi:hypothetical protein